MLLSTVCLVSALPLAAPAEAQNRSGASVLADWLADWRRAASGVTAVRVEETLDRTVDGPRGDIEMRTQGRVTYSPGGRADREVRRAELDGRLAGPPARRRFESRTDRAFGAAADLLRRPPPLAGPFVASATAQGRARAVRLDGRPAWRVTARTPRLDSPVSLWFSRDGSPRLLRVRVEQSLTRRGRAVFEADYRRVNGLDLAESLRTTVTLRQRRRLREYEVSLRARGTYRAPRIVRE
ncbi:MAG: hypothetical protein AAFQ43_07830 [Bacteroidota bacterium]